MSMSTDDFLAHYGIPGMKWGVRRDRSSGGSRRADGKPVQYETARTGARDSAPRGKDLRGRYGTRLGVRGVVDSIGTRAQRKNEKVLRKEWERETGHKTNAKNFLHNHRDPIRKDYTKEEILGARQRMKRANDRVDAIVKKHGGARVTRVKGFGKDTNEFYKLSKYTIQSRDSVVAENRTKGEQAVGFLIGGPLGAYLTSNTNSRIHARIMSKYAI